MATKKQKAGLPRLAIGIALTALCFLASCSSDGAHTQQIRQQAIRRLDAGDSTGALADLNQLIRLTPKDSLAHYNRGLAHSRLGLVAEAIADYNEAIKYNPKDSDSYINRAMLKRITADFEGALRDYSMAIKVDPLKASGNGYHGIALVYLTQGDLGKAKQMADLAIKANANEPGFLATRGVILYSSKDFTSAIADYNRAISLQPSIAGPYANRANAQVELANYQAAMDDMTMYIKLTPNDPRGFFSRALIHSRLGQNAAAKLDLEKAADMFSLQGNEEEARKILEIKNAGSISKLKLNPNTVIDASP